MNMSELANALMEQIGSKRGEIELGRFTSAFPTYDQSSIIAALREIESVGGGKLVLGRGGYKTRFIPMISKATSGGAAALSPMAKAMTEESEHVFVLRRDPVVRVSVPSDLTVQEADRLAAWVKALAIA